MTVRLGMRVWLVLVLVLVVAAGCARRAEESDDDSDVRALVPVRTAVVEERDFADLIEAPGQWRSSGDVALPAPFAAVIESLGPRPGDRVAAGDTLGTVLTRQSRDALRGAELLASEAHDPAARTEAERALALARRDDRDTHEVAPRAGVVTRRGAEPGAEVADGAEVLAITPPEGIVFEARLPAAAARQVHPGEAAIVRTIGEPDRPAHVMRVLPAASATDQATLVWLSAHGAGGTPLIDRFGTATFTSDRTRRSPAVPAAAVVESDLDGSTRVVVVKADSVATWTPVKLGASIAGWRELQGGTPVPGTPVVVEGQRGLPDGTHVKPDTTR